MLLVDDGPLDLRVDGCEGLARVLLLILRFNHARGGYLGVGVDSIERLVGVLLSAPHLRNAQEVRRLVDRHVVQAQVLAARYRLLLS